MAPRVKLFVFADAWFFASIPDPPVAGEEEHWNATIARGDVLNRAILNFSEIAQAVPKLYRHGLVKTSRGRVILTDHGRVVRENGRARRGGLFSIVDNVLAALNSPRIQHPVVTRRPKMESLGLGSYVAGIELNEAASREALLAVLTPKERAALKRRQSP